MKIRLDLLSHKTCTVQIYTGKTVQIVLLSKIFILFTLHLFTTKWRWRATETAKRRLEWIMQRKRRV